MRHLILRPENEAALADFFRDVQSDAGLFHPHPLTDEFAHFACTHRGRDQFYGFFDEDDTLIAYGMLRGWDEGYEIPAVGLIVHPALRGRGQSEAFMRCLSSAAAAAGATRIRGRLLKRNTISRRMCERVGYKFTIDDGDYLIGYADLTNLQS